MQPLLHDNQIKRFCLYGFLKNQTYFEPFLILLFIDNGFSFLQIGFLIGFKSICVNLFEIPAGALTDLWSKKRSLILSMLAYVFAFVVFSFSKDFITFFFAMFFFSIGEVFRSGTHKSMIFSYLKKNGISNKKTEVYGLTRSFSKIGSAISVVLSCIVVLSTDNYSWTFKVAIIPYFLNIINISFYPESNRKKIKHIRFMDIFRKLFSSTREIIFNLKQQTLLLENLLFEGYYSVSKEYLQPIIKLSIISYFVINEASDKSFIAIVVCSLYFFMNLLSAIASKESHNFSKRFISTDAYITTVLIVSFIVYAIASLLIFSDTPHSILFAAISIVVLTVAVNLWKPVFLSEFYDSVNEESATTSLSILNQGRSLIVALLSPLLGAIIDSNINSSNPFLPVYICGTITILMTIINKKRQSVG